MQNVHQIREVSALSFNERVLQEAEDRRNPSMERLKFLGIFSSNMDEFFKVRVASVQRRIELGHSGMQDVLEVLAHKARELDERFRAAYGDIASELASQGIRILNEHDIEHCAQEFGPWLDDYFREHVLPSLVPIILRKSQPFPQLTDGALYFGVKMWGDPVRYAILEIPPEHPALRGAAQRRDHVRGRSHPACAERHLLHLRLRTHRRLRVQDLPRRPAGYRQRFL
ncbi:MAG: hypothetical protein ACOX5J_09485 [Candidatus Hydrogenedentales bacterium]